MKRHDEIVLRLLRDRQKPRLRADENGRLHIIDRRGRPVAAVANVRILYVNR